MSKFPGDDAPTEQDLLDEWLAYSGLTSSHIRRLADTGVTSAAWIRAGHLATPRISTAGRLFTPDPFGTPAFVLPVYDGEPVGELNPNPSVLLVDLLAFHLDDPEHWWLRIGAPHLVLGKDQFIDAMQIARYETICPTPLHWLQAGCEGFCALDLAGDYQDHQRMRARLAKLEAAA